MKRWLSALALVLVTAPAAAEVTAVRAAELLHLLRHDCGSCHGMRLTGGLGPALTADALTGKPTELLVQAILRGRPGTAMPPWDRMLSLEEARWLVDGLKRGEPLVASHGP